MDYLKNKIIENISSLIRTKNSEINLALKIKLVKENNYDWFVESIYKHISKQITDFVMDKIASLNVAKIDQRLEILIKEYIKNIN